MYGQGDLIYQFAWSIPGFVHPDWSFSIMKSPCLSNKLNGQPYYDPWAILNPEFKIVFSFSSQQKFTMTSNMPF